MSTAHQAMLKQKLLEDQQQAINQKFLEDQQQVMPTQMGFFNTFPPNLTFSPFPLGCQQSQKPFSNNSMPSSLASDAPSSDTHLSSPPTTTRSREYDLLPPPLDGPQLLSLQRSAANPWTGWGEVNECLLGSKIKSSGGGEEDHHLGVSAVKMMKKVKSRRKVREPRFCFKTMSDVDVLDDGYKWRKYGQKVVKNTQHPRSYYRCTQDNCHVKKRVERLAEDPRMVITTYEGRHVHSPSHDMEDLQASSHLNNFFW